MPDKDDLISWKKFFSGLVYPVGYFKTLAGIIRVTIIVLFCWLAYMVGVKIHNILAPKPKQPAVFNVTGQQGGCVKNSADQKESKFGLFNF